MKNLQKLKLHNPAEISAQEQGSLKGGGEFVYLDGNWTYLADEVIAYGGSGGVVLNAQSFIGVSECADPCENSLITEWLSTTTNPYADSDETKWCSAFVNAMMIKSGFTGTDSAAAASWLDWGNIATNPTSGDVAVRVDGHHVGIVVCVEGDQFLMVQGNYNDAVAETWENMSDYSFRTY